MTLHERLREVFRAFEHSTSFRRAYDGNVLGTLILLQVIVDALYQRVFGTDDHHLDAVLDDECLHSLKVIGLHGYVFTNVACPGITWGNIQFLTLL